MTHSTDKTQIKKGQKITFNYFGKVYTRKVQQVVTRKYNNRISYNVNKIGSGLGYDMIDHCDVTKVV